MGSETGESIRGGFLWGAAYLSPGRELAPVQLIPYAQCRFRPEIGFDNADAREQRQGGRQRLREAAEIEVGEQQLNDAARMDAIGELSEPHQIAGLKLRR
jgi:hypothetical protein